MAEFTLKIDEMHCGSCVRRVTQALSSVSVLGNSLRLRGWAPAVRQTLAMRSQE